MHEIEAKSILSAQNGMNLYRGCQHGCIYCDARSRCYGMDHAFEDIAVKKNAPRLLEAALRKKRKPCMIGTGAMSDPYIPLETELRLTRRCFELVAQYGFGLAVQTKSDRVLRDLDLFCRINEQAKCVVQMTLTTFDESLCRIVEPNVCTTQARYAALKTLQANGIPTVVWMDPILPFLNDTMENLRGILDLCIDAGVAGIICFGPGLTLREGNRAYFYDKLDQHFPGMKATYIRAFGNAYELPAPHFGALRSLLETTCQKSGIRFGGESVFSYLYDFPEEKRDIRLF